MTVVIGRGYAGACVGYEESAWGTNPGSGQIKLPLVSETLTRNLDMIEQTLKNGYTAARRKPLQVYEKVAGSTVFELDYHNCGSIFEAAFGTDTSGVFTFADELTKSMTLIIDKGGVQRYTYLGGMINTMRLRTSAANPKALLECDWVFKSASRADTALPSASLTTPEYKVLHNQLVFRIADCADALASGDALTITELVLTIENNLKIDQFGSGSAYIIQPVRQNQRKVSLEITVPRYENSDEILAILTAADAHSALQADATWTGSSPRTCTLKLPELYQTPYANPQVSEDYGIMPMKFTFEAFENVNNQTYMSTPTDEAMITIVNS